MHELLTNTVTVFLGFFAIMNPIANTTIFIALTDGESEKSKKQIASKALTITFITILIFSIIGKGIFEMFGITLPAFRITGGILVFFIGYHMLNGETSKMHHPKPGDNEKVPDFLNVAITPLAMPILAGPGTIATAMNYCATDKLIEIVITIGSFLILCFITYLMFISGERLVKFIGENNIKLITRLMGLILAVIGMQMLLEGIKGANIF